jgi:dienelactone hydrolase
MSEEGINVIRFNQYDERPSGRVFHDTTISQHVDDTRQVMNYAREAGFTNVVLAGHSLGGPVTIQAADPDTAGILLWDPTGTPKERASYWEHRDPSSGLAFLKVQMNVLIGEDWLKDAQSFPSTYQTFSNLKMPFKIIAAESGDKLDYCYQYLNARNGDGDFSIINQADHAFTVSGTAEELASESIMWLQDY